MGLGSFVKNSLGGSGLDGLLDPSGKLPTIGDWTGETGAQASLDAAKIQAAQQDKIIKLFQPFADTGAAMLPQYTADSTVAGFGKNIGDILNSGALDSLINERQNAATSYMAARGLRRSGAAVRQAAEIPAELSMQLEQELARRRAGVVNTGLGGIQGAAGGITGVGQALAGGTLGAAQAQAQGMQNIAGIGGILAAAFSDIRLKENVEPIGTIGGLDLVRWTWNREAENLGLYGEDEGFIAQQVQRLYPEYVTDDGGYLKINMIGLLEELKAHGQYH